MQSALAAALEVVLQGIGISTLDDLASAQRHLHALQPLQQAAQRRAFELPPNPA